MQRYLTKLGAWIAEDRLQDFGSPIQTEDLRTADRMGYEVGTFRSPTRAWKYDWNPKEVLILFREFA